MPRRSAPSPRRRSEPSMVCETRDPAAHAATSRSAGTDDHCGAANDTWTTTNAWERRCAWTATTTSATCCGSHAPELWRRTTIALQRELARRCGLSVKTFARAAKVSYSKIAEFQARGLVHLHVPIRLDGPDGPDGAAPD